MTYITYADENGETVRLPLDEKRNMIYVYDDYAPYTLGADEYFVAGDNRYVSHDSRDWNDSDPSRDVGPISGKMIAARVRCVFWPLNRIRGVE